MSDRNQPLSEIRIPSPLPDVDLSAIDDDGNRYEIEICEKCDGTWYVVDGAHWWPTDEAQALIQAHEDPYQMTAFLCVTYPGNQNVGDWHM